MLKKNKKKPRIVAVLGAGNFGTAIAQVLAENGHRVHIWNWEQDHVPLKQIEQYSENKKYLPGVKLLKQIIPIYNLHEALYATEAIFFAVPSIAMEHVVSFGSRSISNTSALVTLSKGLHSDLQLPMSTIISKHVRPTLRKHIVVVSGPSVAEQIVHHHITMLNIAGNNLSSVRKVSNLLENDFVKLIQVNDIIGVEIAGSFKNVYAILMGVCDGMGLGLNTKAALLTFALSEIEDTIVALGGKRETANEIAGLGDLIGTVFSKYSRNRQYGEYLGKGIRPKKAKGEMNQTVEGIVATHCLYEIAKRKNLHLHLAQLVHSMIFGNVDVRKKMNLFLKKL